MRITKTVALVVCLVMAWTIAVAQEAGNIEQILKGVDSWVLTDTAKITAFIDSANAVTTGTIESSKFWNPTARDLTFLLGIDVMTSPQIDNTGRMYFLMRLTGEDRALFYVDKPMGWPIQVTPNSWFEEGLTISGFTVHPSGDFLIVDVYKHGDEWHDLWYFGRNGEFRPLLVSRKLSYYGPIWDEDNPDQFFLFTFDRRAFRIAKYTLSSGVLDTLYTEPGTFYPTDYYRGKMPIIRQYSRFKMQLGVYDVAGNKITNISDTAIFKDAWITEDGKILAYTSIESAENEFLRYCIVDPAEPNAFTVVYDPGLEVDDSRLNRKTNRVYARFNRDGYSELAAFDLTGKTITMPGTGIGIISAMAWNDSGRFVYDFAAPNVPPTAFEFTLGENKPRQIGKVSTFGFDFSNIKVDLIRYKSADGTEIPAFIYFPDSAKKDGSNPAIIEYHGGPAAQSRPEFQRNIAFALSKGFIYMKPNIRGSSGYGPAYEHADNIEGRFAALKDAEAAIDYLINEGWSNPDRIAIWGASYGGYIVNWLTTHSPDKFACAVSEVGISDPDYTMLVSHPGFASYWGKEYGQLQKGQNHELAPLYFADRIARPMLITGGYNDPRVPPSDPRRFACTLARLGKSVLYYEETEAGHGASTKAQTIHDLIAKYVFTMMYVMK